jgi:hypothetical protein
MMTLAVFVANIATDILAVLFIREVTAHHRIRAALVSMLIVALSYFSIIYIVANVYYMIPAMLGAGVGCYITVGRK